MQLGREVHGLKQVEVVVAGGPIRPQPDADAGRQQLRHRCNAGGQLHVALGIVRDLGVAFGDEGDVLVVDPHAVHQERAVVEQSQALEVGDR